MKKLEFLNPSLFKIRTNINGYLDEENSLVQISGYYTTNDWINVGFYIKPTNIVTTIENNNTITYLVYDLSTKKYSFTNSLANVSTNKLYFKLYVYNNKFYASTNDIIPTNISTVNASGTSNFAYYSASSEFSNTALYAPYSETSNISNNTNNSIYSLTADNSNTSLYSLLSNNSINSIQSLTSNISKTSIYSLSTNFSNISNYSLSSDNSLTALYSLTSGTSNFVIKSLTSGTSITSIYSYSTIYAKYVLTSIDRIDLTSATADYFLLLNQEAIISFTNTTKVPLKIATSDGTAYKMHVFPFNPGGTGGGGNGAMFLYPNNITYSNAFVYAEIFKNSEAFSSNYTTYSAFRIGWAISSIICFITNKTWYKNIKGYEDIYGIGNGYPTILTFSTDWRDTATSWTSLGTITFPQNTTGLILIKRIL